MFQHQIKSYENSPSLQHYHHYNSLEKQYQEILVIYKKFSSNEILNQIKQINQDKSNYPSIPLILIPNTDISFLTSPSSSSCSCSCSCSCSSSSSSSSYNLSPRVYSPLFLFNFQSLIHFYDYSSIAIKKSLLKLNELGIITVVKRNEIECLDLNQQKNEQCFEIKSTSPLFTISELAKYFSTLLITHIITISSCLSHSDINSIQEPFQQMIQSHICFLFKSSDLKESIFNLFYYYDNYMVVFSFHLIKLIPSTNSNIKSSDDNRAGGLIFRIDCENDSPLEYISVKLFCYRIVLNQPNHIYETQYSLIFKYMQQDISIDLVEKIQYCNELNKLLKKETLTLILKVTLKMNTYKNNNNNR